MFHGSSGGCPDDAEDQRDTAAGQHRAGGPHERPALAERQGDLDDRAGQDRREDLRHGHVEVQSDLPEDVDRDDDRRDVQTRIADARQDQRVGVAADASASGWSRGRPTQACPDHGASVSLPLISRLPEASRGVRDPEPGRPSAQCRRARMAALSRVLAQVALRTLGGSAVRSGPPVRLRSGPPAPYGSVPRRRCTR